MRWSRISIVALVGLRRSANGGGTGWDRSPATKVLNLWERGTDYRADISFQTRAIDQTSNG